MDGADESREAVSRGLTSETVGPPEPVIETLATAPGNESGSLRMVDEGCPNTGDEE